MEKQVFSVSQINKYVKNVFMYDPLLNNVWVRGEISNLKKHSSGHIYLTLKDKLGSISAVMFKGNASTLLFDLEEGMEVLAQGYISLYEKTGQYQFYVKDMEPDGQGALFKAFEQLKEKLQKEGLFADEYKKQIPSFPKTVGIVTSGTGAAIRDIVNVINRRNKSVQMILAPVLVQGESAPGSIVQAIKYFNQMEEEVDVLIVGRGGGSIEDLWAFNDEQVARTIFQSHIPVISAVGHETDFTISDFVSDLRAPTPSAAAELAVPDMSELGDLVRQLKLRLESGLQVGLDKKREKLEWLKKSRAFQVPERYLDQQRMNLDGLTRRLALAMETSNKSKRFRLEALKSKLEVLSPDNQLQRGYSLVTDTSGTLVHSLEQVDEGQELLIKLKDGVIKVVVNSKESYDE